MGAGSHIKGEMSSNRAEEEDDTVPTMDTTTDEISPLEWLENLEISNPAQAVAEYQKLGKI